MIPGTAIPTTRLTVDDSVQPVKPTQAVTDILSEFRPGERLIAEITSQLPNGSYRALIAQRDVTLALPFSAKAGDTLELEVIDSDGRLTFAVASRPDDAAGKASVLTTLSRTAQLIGNLVAQSNEDGGVAAAPLNGGQPLAAGPASAGELAPLLQRALSQSGLFYEAHQAAWIAGRTTAEALREEPQGRLPVPVASVPVDNASSRTANAATEIRQPAVADSGTTRGAAPLGGLPAEITPLVQQQLNALATNVFAWQGIAWPGQPIDWEIVDADAQQGRAGDEDETPRWQTTLRLSLPSLGAVDAVIGLRGAQVELSLIARSDDTRRTLLAAGEGLRRQYEAAGLQLAALGVATADNAT